MFESIHAGVGIAETVELRDRAAGTAATVAVGYGCNCFSFRVPHRGREVELLYSEPGFPRADLKGTRNGIPILAPFPNRIAGGKFLWEGKEYVLPATDGMGNAIHGFAWDSTWRVVETSTDNSARVATEFVLSRDRPEKLPLWPGDFRLRVEYALCGRELRLAAEVENLSADVLPFGFGTHPYFRIPLAADSTRDDCLVQLPAAKSVELTGCLPTGRTSAVAPPRDLRRGRRIGDGPLDDVYADLALAADGRIHSVVEDRAAGVRLRQTWDAALPYAVAYTPPHGHAVCVEPYSCVTNAINMTAPLDGQDPGLWRLAPGEQRSWRIVLAAETC